MRASVYILVFFCGSSMAAGKSPVYNPQPLVMTAGSAKSSLPAHTIVSSSPVVPTNIQSPNAEERESIGYQQPQEPGSVAAPNPSPTQSYMVYYYANPKTGQSGVYPQQQVYSVGQPGIWSRFGWPEALTALASAGLVIGGSLLTYQKWGPVKRRALRELQDMKSEDAARMAKSVLKALEKVYELRTTK